MIDVSVLRLLLVAITGWLDRREREALAYLIEENCLLRRQIGTRRLQFTDDDRRRLAVRAYRLGRKALRDVATIVTPDTLLRWHRRLVARKCTYPSRRMDRRDVLAQIRQLALWIRILTVIERTPRRASRSRRYASATQTPQTSPR